MQYCVYRNVVAHGQIKIRLLMGDDKLTDREKIELTVEAGLNAIPAIGGSLATLYFGTKQEKRFKRIENFYTDLKNDFEKFKEGIKNLEGTKIRKN